MKNLVRIQHIIISNIFVCMLVLSVTAQNEDVIRIDTEMAQISVAFKQKIAEPFKIEVKDNNIPVTDVSWDPPSKQNPVKMEIIISMNPLFKSKINKRKLLSQLKMLKENNIQLLGINIVEDAGKLGQNLMFPKEYPKEFFSNLSSAVNKSVAILQPARRRALLILTNEIENLPSNIIQQTSDELGQSSMMVYVMSINEKDIKTRKIAQCNVNGIHVVIPENDFLGGLFRSFNRLAANLYTVSYPLPEQEGNWHKIEVSVKRISDNFEIAKNFREFASNKKISVVEKNDKFGAQIIEVAYDKNNIYEDAVKSLANSDFETLLNKRADKLSNEAQEFYLQELRQRPELKGVRILEPTDTRFKQLQKNIEPVLKLYGRYDYTKLFVYEGKNPFIGIYREWILIVSTKALELSTEEQQRSAIAHELAHEIFIDDMKSADKAGNNEQRHLIEYKCDLVAVMATLQIKDNPLAIVEVAEVFTKWYANHKGINETSHPSSDSRRLCIKKFLQVKNL